MEFRRVLFRSREFARMVTLALRIGDARGFSGDQPVAQEIRKHVAQMGHAANISGLRIKVNWYSTGITMNAARHPTSTLMFAEASAAAKIVDRKSVVEGTSG